MAKETLYPSVSKTIRLLETSDLPGDRKIRLQPFLDYLLEKVKSGEPIRLNFICTHNSRRSHLAQVWAQTAAYYYGVPNVTCYSGGTEATALFPAAARALEQDGFEIETLSPGGNPVYAIKGGENTPPVIGFSKKFEDPFNPASGFAAIMTCSQADTGCPFVSGSDLRLALPFEDPKAFDGSTDQAARYLERSRQIAAEMIHVFSNPLLTQ